MGHHLVIYGLFKWGTFEELNHGTVLENQHGCHPILTMESLNNAMESRFG